ncbi:hypothetical protein GQ42DRAFT_153887 [Ramicandelaber brevisporus]|nr:hypothetical protein GQ42DRAFT_153887 [Ramicandelaber brevisporus]
MTPEEKAKWLEAQRQRYANMSHEEKERRRERDRNRYRSKVAQKVTTTTTTTTITNTATTITSANGVVVEETTTSSTSGDAALIYATVYDRHGISDEIGLAPSPLRKKTAATDSANNGAPRPVASSSNIALLAEPPLQASPPEHPLSGPALHAPIARHSSSVILQSQLPPPPPLPPPPVIMPHHQSMPFINQIPSNSALSSAVATPITSAMAELHFNSPGATQYTTHPSQPHQPPHHQPHQPHQPHQHQLQIPSRFDFTADPSHQRMSAFTRRLPLPRPLAHSRPILPTAASIGTSQFSPPYSYSQHPYQLGPRYGYGYYPLPNATTPYVTIPPAAYARATGNDTAAGPSQPFVFGSPSMVPTGVAYGSHDIHSAYRSPPTGDRVVSVAPVSRTPEPARQKIIKSSAFHFTMQHSPQLSPLDDEDGCGEASTSMPPLPPHHPPPPPPPPPHAPEPAPAPAYVAPPLQSGHIVTNTGSYQPALGHYPQQEPGPSQHHPAHSNGQVFAPVPVRHGIAHANSLSETHIHTHSYQQQSMVQPMLPPVDESEGASLLLSLRKGSDAQQHPPPPFIGSRPPDP